MVEVFILCQSDYNINMMNIQLLRHATLLITFSNSQRLLLDPMLSPAGSAPPIAQTPNQKRNPLVDLPISLNELEGLIDGLDGVIVTHTHSDHWDTAAREMLPKELQIFCQPEDRVRIQDAGFKNVQPVFESLAWRGTRFSRTPGRHGRGEIGKLMAPVSGFVLEKEGDPVLYIAGDTVWCVEVEQTIGLYNPDIIVVNAGAAQFESGGPITMTKDDVINTCTAAPEAVVAAVHMESINHCLLSRSLLCEELVNAGLSSRVLIPDDGETFSG